MDLIFFNTLITFINEITLWLDLKFTIDAKNWLFAVQVFKVGACLMQPKGKYIVHCTMGLKIAVLINAAQTLRITHKESSVTYVRRL